MFLGLTPAGERLQEQVEVRDLAIGHDRLGIATQVRFRR